MFDGDLADGWSSYPWSATVEDVGEMLKVDIDKWGAMNFMHRTPISLKECAGYRVTIKDGNGEEFFARIASLTNPHGNGIPFKAETGSEHTFFFEDMGAPTVGTFTNIFAEGQNSNEREPFTVKRIVLLMRAEPLSGQELTTQLEPASTTGGWLKIEGRKFIDQQGRPWVPKGINFLDFRGCNACYGVDYDEMLAESKRRLDFLAGIGVDAIRYCIEHPDQGLAAAPVAYWDALKDFVVYAWETHLMHVELSMWHEATLDIGQDGKPTMGPTEQTIPALRMLVQAFANCGHVLIAAGNEPEGTSREEVERYWVNYNNAAMAIREEEAKLGAKQHVIVVQGLGMWARNINEYEHRRITVEGPVAYGVHAYDLKSAWYERFIRLSEGGMAIVAEEYGPAANLGVVDFGNRNNLSMGDSKYWSLPREQADLFDKFQENFIPSFAWQGNGPRCPPDVIKDNSNRSCGVQMPLELTEWGKMLQRLFAP